MSNHTPGPWKVMPCPVHAGKHMVHDHRWIATANAEVEMSPYVPNDWTINDGILICEMRDTASQPHDARLIAAAPDLLTACKDLVAQLDKIDPAAPMTISDAIANGILFAIARAEGRA